MFADRWTAEVKRTIRDSRVYGTENVVAAIARAKGRPKVLVQASAIGYYGPHGDEELTESSPSGSDFMAVVCREWEEASRPAEALGLRVAADPHRDRPGPGGGRARRHDAHLQDRAGGPHRQRGERLQARHRARSG